jgi:hypothetical protein
LVKCGFNCPRTNTFGDRTVMWWGKEYEVQHNWWSISTSPFTLLESHVMLYVVLLSHTWYSHSAPLFYVDCGISAVHKQQQYTFCIIVIWYHGCVLLKDACFFRVNQVVLCWGHVLKVPRIWPKQDHHMTTFFFLCIQTCLIKYSQW